VEQKGKMSEPKGPFDDAIRILHEAKGEAILVDEELVEVQLDAAIRVLEDWPKWEPLIEAAQRKINIQAMDEGLWFVAITASEEYLQNALRELHAIIKQAIAGYEKGQS
jgi:hypothetical protein